VVVGLSPFCHEIPSLPYLSEKANYGQRGRQLPRPRRASEWPAARATNEQEYEYVSGWAIRRRIVCEN